MSVLAISSLIFISSIGFLALFRILNETRKNLCSIIINILLGGALLTILNLMKIKIVLNFITCGCVALLGVPGVIFTVILNYIFCIL